MACLQDPKNIYHHFSARKNPYSSDKLGVLLLAAVAKRVENTEQYLGKITMQWHDIHILNGYI